MPRQSDLEFRDYLFLGGQVSKKHKEYKMLARMLPETAEIYHFLNKLEEIQKEEDPLKQTLKILEIMGVAEGLKGFGELSRLSMILGDVRERYKMLDWRKQK